MKVPIGLIPTCDPLKRDDERYHVCDSIKELRRERKRRNRAPKSREELEHALAGHDRMLAVSTEIRSRHGKGPLDDNSIIRGYRAKLEALGRPVERKAADPLADIAKRRRQLEHERTVLEYAVREAKLAGLPVSKIAKAMGVSRQRVYQLAG